MEKYYEDKERLKGKERNCKQCNISLSRYNKLNICYICEKNNSTYNNKKISEALSFVAKQAK